MLPYCISLAVSFLTTRCCWIFHTGSLSPILRDNPVCLVLFTQESLSLFFCRPSYWLAENERKARLQTTSSPSTPPIYPEAARTLLES